MSYEQENRRRLVIAPDLWAAVQAVATARRMTPAAIVEEALREKFGPRADLERAARIVADLDATRADLMEKIDHLFLAAFGNAEEVDG